MEAVCTDGGGTAAGAVCRTVPRVGYTTASIGAVGAACSAQAADQTNGRECAAMFATMMVPPADSVPGEWRCADGVWTGFGLAALPIVPASCGTSLRENHYSASCPADSGVCQAACDEGFPQKGGDGVFTCHNGRWTGYLLCLPPDCGPTIDKQPAAASAFAACAGETTLGCACVARCGEGFYATAGSGITTFTCEKEFGGAWLEQGHPFYESSLVCARCPTIENCRVSSCATGTDAVCTECAATYVSFRLDEQPTRCLSEHNTMATDGLTSDATGIIVFGIPPGTTLRAGGDGHMTVGTAASVTVHGAADGTSVLDVGALAIDGAATILGVAMHDAELHVGAGASLTMTMATCDGTITLSISGTATITGSSFSFAAGVHIGLTVQQGGAATVTGATFQMADDTTAAVSVEGGGAITVAHSRLVGADGGSHPFPCDGTLPDCAGEHDGWVVVEGPAAVTLASPLVCGVVTGECKTVTCPALAFDAGSVVATNGGAYTSTATYTCAGDTPPSDGDAEQTCQLNGTWSGATPTTCWVSPFDGSTLMSRAMQRQVVAWLAELDQGAAAGWRRCFDSPNGDDKSSPIAFHAQCDAHARTISIAHTDGNGGNTFGGYAEHSWGGATNHYDTGATADFIFALAPSALKYPPMTGYYQMDGPYSWPDWGNGCLLLGGGSLEAGDWALGVNGICGRTAYVSEPCPELVMDWCGGGLGTWGATELEVWYALA
jgi:hypothetical protein